MQLTLSYNELDPLTFSSRPFLPVKTRIKKMSGFNPVLYRLLVGDYRVYYRIHQQNVVVLGILHKKDTKKWLK